MKIGETVSFRRGRDHKVYFGRLIEVDTRLGHGIVRMADGKQFIRELKRIKPESTGRKEESRKIGLDLKRNSR